MDAMTWRRPNKQDLYDPQMIRLYFFLVYTAERPSVHSTDCLFVCLSVERNIWRQMMTINWRHGHHHHQQQQHGAVTIRLTSNVYIVRTYTYTSDFRSNKSIVDVVILKRCTTCTISSVCRALANELVARICCDFTQRICALFVLYCATMSSL